jgi:predicted transcriptional regulator
MDRLRAGLKTWRQELELTQTQTAVLLNMSLPTIHRFETGAKIMPANLQMIRQFVEHFDNYAPMYEDVDNFDKLLLKYRTLTGAPVRMLGGKTK